MAEPFERRGEPGVGVVARLIAGRTGAGAIAEIEDALARARRVSDVTPAEIAEIADRHGVDLSQRLRTPRKNLYRRFLERCLTDCTLSADESADLEQLRAILRLDAADVARIHDDVALSVYGEAVEQVLRDHRLDPDEKLFLERLRGDLRLAPEVAERLYEKGAVAARQRYLSKVVTPDSVLVASHSGAKLELTGTSDKSLEEAVRAGLDEALRAVPELRWAEVLEIRTELAHGRIARWRVKLKAGLGPED